ncbi:hypothetical protein [Geodermatophilus amargosae]|uniref:hypothetical protein n=1 Tax=Geodermatophilus amargosae TaxID=1296565 RepID=UPI0034DFBFF5
MSPAVRSAAAVVALLVVVALGVAGVVLGEADDSPGLQGLGVLLVIGAVVVGVRAARRAGSGAAAAGRDQRSR